MQAGGRAVGSGSALDLSPLSTSSPNSQLGPFVPGPCDEDVLRSSRPPGGQGHRLQRHKLLAFGVEDSFSRFLSDFCSLGLRDCAFLRAKDRKDT